MKNNLSDKALLNKAKLWCVLHHSNLEEAVDYNCQVGKCPNCKLQPSGEEKCNLTWLQKLATDSNFSDVGRLGKHDLRLPICIEWVKYV